MRLIDGDILIMLLTDWWHASFGQTETQESKAIKAVLDQVEIHVKKHGCKPCELVTQMSLPSHDCISRQTAIDAFDGAKVDEGYVTEYEIRYNDGIDFAVSKLSVLPSAQSEVIRCKDCKHWKIGTENLNCPNPMICGLHSFMHGFERASLPEDYCSWAERKDND